jgi:hypothetical protein
MNRRREDGLALILVMTVVLALAIIATPFVLSMILQERTGTTARYLSQADYGADGAKNYALWRLMQSLDPIERRAGTGIFSSYYYDTRQEFDIRLDEELKTSKLQITDPKGAIWGINVEDEQGKLNARTCNVDALNNLARMVDGRVVNLKDYITLYSGRDASWACPQKIRGVGYAQGQSGGGITVDNLTVLAPRSRVRISKPGMKAIETRITGNALLGQGGQNGFSTEIGGAASLDAVIEVELRHPVNLNTAKRDTLVALFEGLRLFNPQTGRYDPSSLVDHSAALNLATRFTGRDVQRLEQFLMILASAPLSPQQKVAVAINAVCPSWAFLMDSGTQPLCFKSYDVYTLEAFASMNSPAGTEVAGRGYREVVSVSPPSTLRLECESQYDFNQMMSQVSIALAAQNPQQVPVLGFPYGNRMLSYPQPYTQLSDVTLKPQQRAPNEAFVTVAPSADYRGELLDTRFEADLTGWNEPNSAHNRYHYPQELDGKKEKGAESFPWTQFFALNHTSEDDQLQPAQQRPDTGSGGFEIWTRFDSAPGDVSIFEIHEQQTTNRVSLRTEGSDLVLTAADATIPYTLGDPDGRIANGVAEIRWPNFKITADTWTHFSAHWKSNRYADLALLVDGFADPQQKFMHYTQPGGQQLMTTLSSALTPTTTTITLKSTQILPSASELTPLLLGEEVILYDHTSGTTVRGARNTVAIDHPSQVNVSLFGYSSKIKNGTVIANYPNIPFSVTMTYSKLPQTNATGTYNFGANPQASVAGDKQDPITRQYEIQATETTIGVVSGAINDFPDQGYIRIDDEIIYYTGRGSGTVAGSMPPANASFTGCQRSLFGSVAAVHRSGAQVHLWSVAASNLTNYPSPTIIQIGEEWFGPVQRDPSGKNFWVGFMNGTTPVNFRRGNAVFASLQQNHSAGDKVLPTFLGQDVNSWPCRGYSMGAGDRVTLSDAGNQKASARIRRTNPPPTPAGQPPIWPGEFSIQQATQVAALYDFATRDWVPDDLHVRVLKFPSGELLSRAWLDTANPQVTIGPITGQIDELKAFAASKGRVRLSQIGQVGDTTFSVAPVAIPFFQEGGLLKMGDEYIGYGNWTQGQTMGTIKELKRGWLNSTAEIHDNGENAFYLPWIPVSALASDLTADDHVIRLKQRLSGDPNLYKKGYILVDNEMMLFEWNNNDGLVLSMPARWDGQKGLYRGMFGTPNAQHSSATSLVYGMPFRTWDTYKAREFDTTMVYYQWSTKLDLAHWHSFRWVQEIPAQDKNIVVHALARIDGRGEFWDPPGMTQNVLLLDSTAAGGNVKVDRTSYLQDAGQFDVRFYIEYKQGSFDTQNPRNAESWKRCPKIKEIQVEYDRPTQTLHHEDR